MQSIIAITAFLALKLCDNLFYQSYICIYYLFWPLGLAWLLSMKRIESQVHCMQARWRRYLPAIKSSTVEFHKAQCFFMLAIDIATQVVVREGSLNDGSATLQGLFNNYTLIGTISISGLLPITFTLLSLHSVNMRSWYLLSLSTTTVVLSALTLLTTGEFQPSSEDMLSLRPSTNATFTKCGSKDPSTFCLEPEALDATIVTVGHVGGNSLVLSLVVIVLIILNYCRVQDMQSYKYLKTWWLVMFSYVLQGFKRAHGVIRVHKSESSSTTSMGLTEIEVASTYTANFLYLVIWSWYIVFFVLFKEQLALPGYGASPVIIARTWSFGQIIAITVWAMPLFEFVKLSAREF